MSGCFKISCKITNFFLILLFSLSYFVTLTPSKLPFARETKEKTHFFFCFSHLFRNFVPIIKNKQNEKVSCDIGLLGNEYEYCAGTAGGSVA